MDFTKSFIDPEKALIVFNHYPLASLEGAWTSHEVITMYDEAKKSMLPGGLGSWASSALQELLR